MDWTKKAREFLEQHKFIQAAHIASFASEVERLTMERAAKAQCGECRKGDTPELIGGTYLHTMLGFDDRTEHCSASRIRLLAVASSQGGEQG